VELIKFADRLDVRSKRKTDESKIAPRDFGRATGRDDLSSSRNEGQF
jgi:hypothetical protein